MPEYYFEDGVNVRTNSVTVTGCGGIAYNAVLKVDFSAENATEPVLLQEAKDWCRIDVTDDDSLVTKLIKAARIICERYVNLSFITRIVTAKVFNGIGGINLPYGPVVGAITSITDANGNVITGVNMDLPNSSVLTVVYNAGYATLPEDLRTAILDQVAWMYENRGDTKIASSLSLTSQLTLQPLRNIE